MVYIESYHSSNFESVHNSATSTPIDSESSVSHTSAPSVVSDIESLHSRAESLAADIARSLLPDEAAHYRELFVSVEQGGRTPSGGRQAMPLAGGVQKVKTVARQMANGQGIDHLRGTIIVGAGVPKRHYVLHRYDNGWHSHCLEDPPASPPEQVLPSAFLENLQKQEKEAGRPFRLKVYRLCQPGDVPRPLEEYPPGFFSRPWDYLKALRHKL